MQSNCQACIAGGGPAGLILGVLLARAGIAVTVLEWATSMTQRLQLVMQDNVIAPALTASGELKPPAMLRLIGAVPWLARFPARIISLGVRPEHISPALFPQT